MRTLLALLVVFSTNPAFADLAPPPGYVETCTIANHQKDGLTCVSCTANFKERDKCSLELGTKGYTKACRTRGASAWSEVWCIETKPAEPTEPEPTKPDPVEPEPAEPDEKATQAGLEVKAADLAPKRDSKCGAGGLDVGLPLLFALVLVGRRTSPGLLRIRREAKADPANAIRRRS